MKIQRGREVEPPRGFRRTIRLCGRRVRIRYYTTLKDLDLPKSRRSLNGCMDTDTGEILLATWRVCRDTLIDSLLHEACHWILAAADKRHGERRIDEETEEVIVLLLESGLGGLLRQNRWIRELYDESRPDNQS